MSLATLAVLITIAGGILAILARIFGVFGAIRRWSQHKAPVRLKCEDAGDFHPIAGGREAIRIEAFNRSDSEVEVKGFGLELTTQGQAAPRRYEVAGHPPGSFPKRLLPHGAFEGEIDKKALGDQPFMQDCTGVHAYVDIAGLRRRTIDIWPLPRPTWRFILEGVVVAGLAALVARSLAPDIRLDIGTAGEPSRFITNLIQTRGVTWAVAGVALGIWLAFRVRAAHDYGRCALLGLLVGAIAGALGGAIFGFPVAYGEDQNRFSTTAQLINVGSFAVAGALIGALIVGLWLPPRVAAGLASGGVAAALAVAPFVGGDTNEWVFCLNAAAIAGATLATMVAIDAKRPTIERPVLAAGP
jgi:hypothetical protein